MKSTLSNMGVVHESYCRSERLMATEGHVDSDKVLQFLTDNLVPLSKHKKTAVSRAPFSTDSIDS